MLSDNLFSSLSLFKDIQAQTQLFLSQASKLNYYKKGTLFYTAQATEKSYLYYIVRGWVKLFTVSLEGTEIIRDILTDAHHFNEALLFKDKIEPLCAQAISDTQVITTPIAILKQGLMQDAQLAVNLLRNTIQKQCELIYTVEHLSIQNAAQRIGCFLLRLCPVEKTQAITIHLPYDKALVAARLGMCPETFSRALMKLRKLCRIKVMGEIIHIPEINFLTQYICSQCSLNYPCQAALLSSSTY
ncbi:Crp/Fnr family transcriptional regulator [Legionella dresdenensis]|uniref:Crp/Fnr family transcriptional regulator n=1 Tax=Legionella dresdenensis TaxID=450200 RepID=A0ABV8CB74_9GAMM